MANSSNPGTQPIPPEMQKPRNVQPIDEETRPERTKVCSGQSEGGGFRSTHLARASRRRRPRWRRRPCPFCGRLPWMLPLACARPASSVRVGKPRRRGEERGGSWSPRGVEWPLMILKPQRPRDAEACGVRTGASGGEGGQADRLRGEEAKSGKHWTDNDRWAWAHERGCIPPPAFSAQILSRPTCISGPRHAHRVIFSFCDESASLFFLGSKTLDLLLIPSVRILTGSWRDFNCQPQGYEYAVMIWQKKYPTQTAHLSFLLKKGTLKLSSLFYSLFNEKKV